MSRTTRIKIGILCALILIPAGVVAAAVASDFNLLVLFGLPIVLLVPGRIQRRVLRDFFRGRRLLESGQPEAALELFLRFRNSLRTEPRKRRWLVLVSVYTSSADAMVLNNIGAAHLHAGNLDDADAAFREALAADPLYPIPHFNRAVLAAVRGPGSGGSACGGGGAPGLHRGNRRQGHPQGAVHRSPDPRAGRRGGVAQQRVTATRGRATRGRCRSCTAPRVCMPFFYSYRSASIGSMLAAFTAGYTPKTSPTAAEKPSARVIAYRSRLSGASR